MPCSDRCHETMGTEGVCVMPEEYIPFSDRGHETMATYGA